MLVCSWVRGVVMAEQSKQSMWLARIASWSRSGLSQRVWRQQHHVSVHTFDYWRRQLRGRAAGRKTRAASWRLPIVVAAPSAAVDVELVLPSGVRLRIPEGADAGHVAALVRALGR